MAKLTSAQVLEHLAATPQRIASMTDAVEPAQLQAAPAPGAWSANEVLAHLRSCADMWGQAIEQILIHDHPTLKAVNPTTWIKHTNYTELAFQSSLVAFTAQRQQLMALLEPLDREGWQRAATVNVAGKPYQRTVFFYAHWLAIHERPHIKQIERILKHS